MSRQIYSKRKEVQMRRIGHVPFDVPLLLGIALTVCLVLTAASMALAQSANDQYGGRQLPSGPAAGLSCIALESSDGLLNAGDSVTFGGNFSVAPGASVVIEDADGTQGLLVDGVNANISEGAGGITIVVTGEPMNVVGGDGVMSDVVCDSIVTTTGIFLSAGEAPEDEGAILSVLPDTSGPLLIGLLGGLAAVGTGLAIFRRAQRQ
jgi:hypothetical protein